jgi:hypothetical protein
MKYNIADLDIFYISYDEPDAAECWLELDRRSPRGVKRVHGVKGFHRAHYACAEASTTKRFVTIDGDNWVDQSLFSQTIDDSEGNDLVFSFKARNIINGLEYGNGGVKVWPKNLVLQVPTHEAATNELTATDFCWKYRYMQVNHMASFVHCNKTPLQAFRSGYREAVKLSMVCGKKLPTWHETLDHIDKWNLSRLLVWMSVGGDVVNGIDAIIGARTGFYDMWLGSLNLEDIRDYDWFAMYYRALDLKGGLADFRYLSEISTKLEQQLNIDKVVLDERSSQWFKIAYVNPDRSGIMRDDIPRVEFDDRD